MSRPRPLAAIAFALLLVTLAPSVGCAAIAGAMTDDGGGVTRSFMRGGFWAGAIAGAPVAAAALPLTMPFAAATGDHDAIAIVAGPAILTGAVVGAAFAVPGAIIEAPVLLVQAIADAFASKPSPPAAPTWEPPPAPAPTPPDPPPAPGASQAPPDDALDAALAPDREAAGTLPRAPCRGDCCHGLAVARLLPPHEHEVGLTQALFAVLTDPRAASEAERLLAERADAAPLLLRGLSDPERGAAAARVLVARRRDPAVVPGLVDVALDPGAGEVAQRLAREALLAIERLTPEAR